MPRFVEMLSAELGHDTLAAVLSKSGLPEEWTLAAHFGALDDERTARVLGARQCEFKIVSGG